MSHNHDDESIANGGGPAAIGEYCRNKGKATALDFRCPICNAPEGTPCRQRGEDINPHDARSNAAGKVNTGRKP